MVQTRAALPDDAEAITRIRIHGWQAGFEGIVPATYLAGLDAEIPRLAAGLRERIEAGYPYHRILVAESDGEVVGFTNAGRYRVNQNRNDLHPHLGEVYAIYVDPPRWRSGTGRVLLDAAVGWLGEVGLAPVLLWVLEGNARARAFYERYGFGFDGERGRFVIKQAGQLPVELPELRYRLAAPPPTGPPR